MAYVTTKMLLRVWNLIEDRYDHSQLADNWLRVDLHDHTPGRGLQVPTEGIADGAITNVKLSSGLTATPIDGSVTEAKLETTFAASLGRDVFSGYRNTAVNLASASTVPFDTEEYDTSGVFDPGTGQFTPPTGEVWRVSWRVGLNTGTGGISTIGELQKSGSAYKRGSVGQSVPGTPPASTGTALAVGDGSSFTVAVQHNFGSATAVAVGAAFCYFQGERVA